MDESGDGGGGGRRGLGRVYAVLDGTLCYDKT